MKLKKVFTVILMVLVILSLGASYILTAFGPQQATPQPVAPATYTPPAQNEGQFVIPTTPPSVKGPTTAPSTNGPQPLKTQ
jgi:flagellar basal body-associated protein FliL